MNDSLPKSQAEWLSLHNHQYDLRGSNHERDKPFTEEELTEHYYTKLHAYFSKYPDLLTDYYSKMIYPEKWKS